MIGKDPETAGKYGYEDLYRYYQQINKRGLAGTSRNPDDAEKIFKRNEGINNGKYTVNAEERGFKYATYLMIRGVYTKKNPVGGRGSEQRDLLYLPRFGQLQRLQRLP